MKKTKIINRLDKLLEKTAITQRLVEELFLKTLEQGDVLFLETVQDYLNEQLVQINNKSKYNKLFKNQ